MANMETHLTQNLQTSVGSFLLKLGENGQTWWFTFGLLCMLVLFFLTAQTAIYRSKITTQQEKSNQLSAFLRSNYFFSLCIAFTILFLRFPGLSRLELNPDESEWMAGALTLLVDPRFWLSVDGYTGGPLLIFPVTIIHFLGGTINYGTIKLLGVCIWILSTLLIYYSFINYFKDTIARIIILPLIACVSTFYYQDYVAYNSEHIPTLLIALSLFLYSKTDLTVGNKRYVFIFLCSFVLGSVPYAKLQAVPIALIIALFLLLFSGWKGALYAVLGGITPSIITLCYLFTTGIFNDFWQSYILNNLSYASKGLGERNLTFSNKISLFGDLIVNTYETRSFFILHTILIIISTSFLIKYRNSVLKKEYKIIILAFLLTVTSIYCVIQPGNDFTHYLLLTILPIAFFTGTVIGTLLNRYDIYKLNAHDLPSFIIISCLIVISTALPLANDNPAFRQAFYNTINGTMGSNVAQKILEYAEQNDKMAIWGWAEKYHAETGIAQGTRESHPFNQMVANDQQSYYVDRYLYDLNKNKPAIFVEAVGPNQFYFTDSVAYSFNNIPLIKNIVNKNYKYVETVDGVKIYVAKNRQSKINFKDFIIKVDTLPQEQPDIAYNVESIRQDTTSIWVSGWAFIQNQPTKDNTINVILKSDSNTYAIKTKLFIRPDVAGHFNNYNLDRSGFLAPILKTEILPGNYRIGIQINNHNKDVKSLIFTDKTISF